jgi:hypothetical protein
VEDEIDIYIKDFSLRVIKSLSLVKFIVSYFVCKSFHKNFVFMYICTYIFNKKIKIITTILRHFD